MPDTAAVCSVVRKLVPMLLRVMQTAEPFDLERWRANRQRRAARRLTVEDAVVQR